MSAPTPQAIRTARETAKLSRKEAADLIYKSVRSWEKWETGERPMDPAFWCLFMVLTGAMTIEQITRNRNS